MGCVLGADRDLGKLKALHRIGNSALVIQY